MRKKTTACSSPSLKTCRCSQSDRRCRETKPRRSRNVLNVVPASTRAHESARRTSARSTRLPCREHSRDGIASTAGWLPAEWVRVYQAFDLALDHDVAAKVIKEDLAARDGFLKRFFEEARHAARLRDHPNVVTVYDFGHLGDQQAYLIMELLQGRTLRHLLETQGRIDRVEPSAFSTMCARPSPPHTNYDCCTAT